MIATLTTSLFCLPLGQGVSLTNTTGPALRPPEIEETSETAEDVEILRRLLVEALDERPDRPRNLGLSAPVQVSGEEIAYTPLLTGTLSSFYDFGSPVTHSRGFHVPEAGLFFSIDVQVPVVQEEVEPPEEEAEDEGSDDEWERVRRAVRTGATAGDEDDDSAVRLYWGQMLEPTQVTWRLDPAAVDRLEQAVLKTLAHHSGRVRGLSGSDTVTVALHLEPAVGLTTGLTVTSTHGEGDGTVWSLVGASQARPMRLVIQLRVDDADRSSNGSGLEEARRRARVVRY